MVARHVSTSSELKFDTTRYYTLEVRLRAGDQDARYLPVASMLSPEQSGQFDSYQLQSMCGTVWSCSSARCKRRALWRAQEEHRSGASWRGEQDRDTHGSRRYCKETVHSTPKVSCWVFADHECSTKRSFKTVTFLCGPKQTPITTVKSVIAYFSPFFDRRLYGAFKNKENPEQAIELPEDDPQIFQLFVDWMLTGTFHETMGSGRCKLEDEKYDCEPLVVASWVLGDKYLCKDFCNAVMRHFFACPAQWRVVESKTARFVFEKALPNAKLRQAIVDNVQLFGPLREARKNNFEEEYTDWLDFILNASSEGEKEAVKACLEAGGFHNGNGTFPVPYSAQDKYLLESTSVSVEEWRKGEDLWEGILSQHLMDLLRMMWEDFAWSRIGERGGMTVEPSCHAGRRFAAVTLRSTQYSGIANGIPWTAKSLRTKSNHSGNFLYVLSLLLRNPIARVTFTQSIVWPSDESRWSFSFSHLRFLVPPTTATQLQLCDNFRTFDISTFENVRILLTTRPSWVSLSTHQGVLQRRHLLSTIPSVSPSVCRGEQQQLTTHPPRNHDHPQCLHHFHLLLHLLIITAVWMVVFDRYKVCALLAYRSILS